MTLWFAVGVIGVAVFASLVLGFREHRRTTRHATLARAGLVSLIGWGERRPEPAPLRWLARALVALIAGYIFFDRAFAWLHVPGTPAFVGEIVLALGILALLVAPTRLGRAVRASGALQILVTFLGWGALLLVLALGTYGIDAVRDSAIWYYGLTAVFVVALVVSRPQRLQAWIRLSGRAIPLMLLWFFAAPFISAALRGGPPYVPNSVVSIGAHRPGNIAVLTVVAIAYLWLVDHGQLYSGLQRAALTALGSVVLLVNGLINRGGLVAAVIAIVLLVAFIAKKRSDVLVVIAGVGVLLVSLGLMFNVEIELRRGRSLSVDQLVQNVQSVFNLDAGGTRQTATTRWRLDIWEQVIDDVTRETPLTGFGPGPHLGERYDITGRNQDLPLRNPHNSHVGILARTGWVGAMLWVALWVTWYLEMYLLRQRLNWRGRRREGRVAAWLMVFVTPILVNAIFDPTLEGPQVAMVLWAVVGLGASMVILERAGALPALTLEAQRQPSHAERVSTELVG